MINKEGSSTSRLTKGGSLKQLTKERLKEALRWDDDNEVFIWRVNRGNNFCKDRVAGTLNEEDGRIRLDDVTYRVSTLYKLYHDEVEYIDDEEHFEDIEHELWMTKWR